MLARRAKRVANLKFSVAKRLSKREGMRCAGRLSHVQECVRDPDDRRGASTPSPTLGERRIGESRASILNKICKEAIGIMIGKLTAARTIPNNLVLDEHTKPFFSPKYHEGAVEARIRFPSYRKPGAVFGVRLARLITSEWMVVAQEQHPDREEALVPAGPCLVWEARPCLTRIERKNYWADLRNEQNEFWGPMARLLARSRGERENLLTLNPGNVWRYYFDPFSSVGCRICRRTDWGSDLVDLNPLAQRAPGRLGFRISELHGIPWLGAALDNVNLLLRLDEAEYRQKMQEFLRDPRGSYHSLLPFYAQNENQRHRDALQCTPLVRALAQTRLEAELLQSFGEGNDLGDFVRVSWRPWGSYHMRAYLVDGTHTFIPVPNGLKDRCVAICEELGCTLPLVAVTREKGDGGKFSWAHRFICNVRGPSFHEISMYILPLLEKIEALESEIARTPGI